MQSNTVMTISINLNKAREIHKNKIREARAPKLENLDLAFMRAVETSDTKERAAIAKKKQALRDATKQSAIEEATDVEDLILSWDEDLLGPSPYNN